MNGAGKELLPGSGVAQDEHRRTGGGDDLDLLEDLLECGTLADDFLEILLSANLLLEI